MLKLPVTVPLSAIVCSHLTRTLCAVSTAWLRAAWSDASSHFPPPVSPVASAHECKILRRQQLRPHKGRPRIESAVDVRALSWGTWVKIAAAFTIGQISENGV